MAIYVDREKFDVKVCYVEGSSDGKTKLDKCGMSIYLDPDGRLGGSRLKTVCALARLLKKERPDIVHCHRHKPTVLGLAAAFFAGVEHVVAHVHGLNRTRTLSRRLANKFAFSRVERVLTVSDGVRSDVLSTNPGLGADKVTTIHNGMDIEAFDSARGTGPEENNGAKGRTRDGVRETLGVKPGELVFGSVGRLAPTKGQIYLVEAFVGVLKKLPHARLLMVGDGPLRAELEESAGRLGISGKVSFVGHRRDVPLVLKGFDVFVFPSLAEGLPLGLLEAMAARLPIVASRVGGIPEVVTLDFARLVPPAEPALLADAMVELGSMTEEKVKEFGRAARERVEDEFTSKTMCSRLMDVYEEILAP